MPAAPGPVDGQASPAALPTGSCAVQAVERVVFGRPAEAVLTEEVRTHGARRVFLLSTRSLAALADGPLQRIEASLAAAHAGTFSRISAHSPDHEVLEASRAACAAEADLLVAVGGGSVIDAAKAVQWCLTRGIDDVAALRAAAGTFAGDAAVPPALRAVAVPTTLSAAEFMPMAGITDTSNPQKEKRPLRERWLVPRCVVLDPRATLDTPLWLWLSTGIRAIDHAVETFCAPGANLVTDGFALRGLRRLSTALRAVAADPTGLRARLDAQLGMWDCVTPATAGVGVGASHGIGYALGAGFAVPHGYMSCVMLPAVLRWNAPVNAARQADVAAALARQRMGSPSDAAAGLASKDAGACVADLVRALGLPDTLREVGVPRDALPSLARQALAYPPVRQNPRPIRDEGDVLAILELAWQGVK